MYVIHMVAIFSTSKTRRDRSIAHHVNKANSLPAVFYCCVLWRLAAIVKRLNRFGIKCPKHSKEFAKRCTHMKGILCPTFVFLFFSVRIGLVHPYPFAFFLGIYDGLRIRGKRCFKLHLLQASVGAENLT